MRNEEDGMRSTMWGEEDFLGDTHEPSDNRH